MSALPALPTLREELDRKAFETIEWLFVGLDKGRLTQEQFSTGIDALFMAVSGLVDKDFIHMITEAQAMCDGSKPIVKKHFHAPERDEILTFSWVPGEDKITTCKRICGMASNGAITNFKDAQAAAGYMGRVSASMEKRGWIEL